MTSNNCSHQRKICFKYKRYEKLSNDIKRIWPIKTYVNFPWTFVDGVHHWPLQSDFFGVYKTKREGIVENKIDWQMDDWQATDKQESFNMWQLLILTANVCVWGIPSKCEESGTLCELIRTMDTEFVSRISYSFSYEQDH